MSEVSPWIPVGALGAAFGPDRHVLPPGAAPAGGTLQRSLEDDSTLSVLIGELTSQHGSAAPSTPTSTP